MLTASIFCKNLQLLVGILRPAITKFKILAHRVLVLFRVGSFRATVKCRKKPTQRMSVLKPTQPMSVLFRSFRCRFFPVSVSCDQNTNWTFSDKRTHLFSYRGIFLALRPAMRLLDIFRQMDAKNSGYRGVLGPLFSTARVR